MNSRHCNRLRIAHLLFGTTRNAGHVGKRKEALRLFRWLISWGEDELAYGECGEGIQAARSMIADCYYRVAKILEAKGQRMRAIAAYKEHLSRRTRGHPEHLSPKRSQATLDRALRQLAVDKLPYHSTRIDHAQRSETEPF